MNRAAGDLVRDVRDRLDPMDGPHLIALACGIMAETQKDLADRSGISTTTITQIKRGKRATNAQRRAIYWAVLERMAG